MGGSKNQSYINNCLKKLQNRIRVRFRNKSLLNRAITHRSYSNEINAPSFDNERLEYLGDSVLGLVVNEYLYKRFADYHEGELAKIKSAVVSEDTLSKIAHEINLGDYLLLGRGEELSGGRGRSSILANAMEALIGAMYLDSGLKTTKNCILSLIKKHIDNIDKIPDMRDPKTSLQEIVQKKYKEKPLYEVIEEKGPDHKKEFVVKLVIHDKNILNAHGSSKRKAEAYAAKKALTLYSKGELEI
jgi:ribonuclease-3